MAATKYPWVRDVGRKEGQKWGAYAGDATSLEWVIAHRPEGVEFPLEEQILDWADDVTYAVHDVEDWYRLGLIPLHALFDFNLAADHPSAGQDENITLGHFLDGVEGKWRLRGRDFDRREVVRALHALADQISVEEPFTGTRVSKGRVQATVSDLITFFTDPITTSSTGVAYEASLIVPEDRRILCDLLKELVWHYVIGSTGLAAQQHGQARIVRALVDWMHDDPDRLLPADRKAEYEEHGDLTRTIADHVATLTEPMAINIYGKLSGTNLGAMTDTT
jgi:dGTPase